MTEIPSKSQNICFVANAYKTFVFEAIANNLQGNGMKLLAGFGVGYS